MVLFHISLPTGPSKYKSVRDFYLATLQPLGYTVYLESDPSTTPSNPGTSTSPQYCGLQAKNGADFWLHAGDSDPSPSQIGHEHVSMAGKGVHVAWLTDSTAKVDEWYKLAL